MTLTPHNVPIITIDGPSGSGKGTASRLLAAILNWNMLDSGLIYRLVAYKILHQGVELNDPERIANLANSMIVKFQGSEVYLDSYLISRGHLKSTEISDVTSKISVYPEVRSAVFDLFQSFAKEPGLIADGRDMGTVVFKDAPLKIFLTASSKVRAVRRFAELQSEGYDGTLSELEAALQERDKRDSSRAVAPLTPAQDAVLIDSSELTADEVVALILREWELKQQS